WIPGGEVRARAAVVPRVLAHRLGAGVGRPADAVAELLPPPDRARLELALRDVPEGEAAVELGERVGCGPLPGEDRLSLLPPVLLGELDRGGAAKSSAPRRTG